MKEILTTFLMELMREIVGIARSSAIIAVIAALPVSSAM